MGMDEACSFEMRRPLSLSRYTTCDFSPMISSISQSSHRQRCQRNIAVSFADFESKSGRFPHNSSTSIQASILHPPRITPHFRLAGRNRSHSLPPCLAGLQSVLIASAPLPPHLRHGPSHRASPHRSRLCPISAHSAFRRRCRTVNRLPDLRFSLPAAHLSPAPPALDWAARTGGCRWPKPQNSA